MTVCWTGMSNSFLQSVVSVKFDKAFGSGPLVIISSTTEHPHSLHTRSMQDLTRSYSLVSYRSILVMTLFGLAGPGWIDLSISMTGLPSFRSVDTTWLGWWQDLDLYRSLLTTQSVIELFRVHQSVIVSFSIRYIYGVARFFSVYLGHSSISSVSTKVIHRCLQCLLLSPSLITSM